MRTLSTRFLSNVAGKTQDPIGNRAVFDLRAPFLIQKMCLFLIPPMVDLPMQYQWENTPEAQWEFQDPKMGVLYHIRPYLVGIFPYIGLIIIGLICGWYLQFKILEWPLISRSLWASPQVWAVVLKTPSNRTICPFLTPSAPTGYQSSIHNGYIMIGCLMQISDIILRAHGYIDRYIHRYIDRYRYR